MKPGKCTGMNIRKFFDKIYWKMKGYIAPSMKYAQTLYEETLAFHISSDTEWLDLECGHNVLPPWRSKEEKSLVKHSKRTVGMDYDF